MTAPSIPAFRTVPRADAERLEIDQWLAPCRQRWRRGLGALERHLDREAPGEKGTRR